MEPAAGADGRATPSAAVEVHVLWITAGLGCDGDTIAITAATNPSLEDLVLGAVPGIPRVHLHNPVLAYAVGDDFLRTFERAAAGELAPFVLVVEGSIPNERNKDAGFWAAMGCAVGLDVVEIWKDVTGREAVHIIVSAALGAALATFAMLDWRGRSAG